jgi:hypothetical protein
VFGISSLYGSYLQFFEIDFTLNEHTIQLVLSNCQYHYLVNYHPEDTRECKYLKNDERSVDTLPDLVKRTTLNAYQFETREE